MAEEAIDFAKFVEKFMAEVPGGPDGDKEMRRRDPTPFVDTTAADIRPDKLTDQLYELGYVDIDGKQSPVVSIRTNIERDVEHFSYTSADLLLVDELGRESKVVVGPRTSLAVWPAGGLESHDGAGYGTVNGARALVHIEEGWNPDYVERRKVFLSGKFDGAAGAKALSANRGVGAHASKQP